MAGIWNRINDHKTWIGVIALGINQGLFLLGFTDVAFFDSATYFIGLWTGASLVHKAQKLVKGIAKGK